MCMFVSVSICYPYVSGRRLEEDIGSSVAILSHLASMLGIKLGSFSKISNDLSQPLTNTPRLPISTFIILFTLIINVLTKFYA